jgi:SET domain-containing protein
MSLPPPTVFSELVEVKPSSIHGLGLFAKVDLPVGTRITDYKGEKMTNAEFKEIYGTDTRYTYSLGRTNCILSGKNCITENLSHYANESNNPNIYLKKRGVYTVRDVVAGEELFLLYPKKYPRDYSLK